MSLLFYIERTHSGDLCAQIIKYEKSSVVAQQYNAVQSKVKQPGARQR